jgi:hypothetical protein
MDEIIKALNPGVFKNGSEKILTFVKKDADGADHKTVQQTFDDAEPDIRAIYRLSQYGQAMGKVQCGIPGEFRVFYIPLSLFQCIDLDAGMDQYPEDGPGPFFQENRGFRPVDERGVCFVRFHIQSYRYKPGPVQRVADIPVYRDMCALPVARVYLYALHKTAGKRT